MQTLGNEEYQRDNPHAPGTMKVDRYSRRPYRCGDATWTNKLSLLSTTMLNAQHFSERCEKRRSYAFITFPRRRKAPSAKVMAAVGRTVPKKLTKFRSHSFPVIEPEKALIRGVGFAVRSPEEHGDQGNRSYNLRTPSVRVRRLRLHTRVIEENG